VHGSARWLWPARPRPRYNPRLTTLASGSLRAPGRFLTTLASGSLRAPGRFLTTLAFGSLRAPSRALEEPPMAAIKLTSDVTLKHQANLGEEVRDVDFEQGTRFEVLHKFDGAWLVKDDDGRLFNVKRDLAEEA